jgi:hypothetical protein
MWKLGLRPLNSFSGNIEMGFLLQWGWILFNVSMVTYDIKKQKQTNMCLVEKMFKKTE